MLVETGRKTSLAQTAANLAIADEDVLRAHWYGLLGAVLRATPQRALLERLAALAGDETEFGQGVQALAAAARTALARAPETGDAGEQALDKTLEQEYFDLFVGVGRGELLPYGSYYLAGFLYEKPLARLRGDMRRLGIARAEGVHEPEDHIAALMEMMSGLITGAFGQPAELATQRQFFAAHIGSWAPRFFEDLESAEAADFYRSVGRVARQFVAIEAEAFEMTA
jgi:TorA maturation chaperone TorD